MRQALAIVLLSVGAVLVTSGSSVAEAATTTVTPGSTHISTNISATSNSSNSNASDTTQTPGVTNRPVTDEQPPTANISSTTTTLKPEVTNASLNTMQRPSTTTTSVPTGRPGTTNSSTITQRPDTTNVSATTKELGTTNASITTRGQSTTNASVTTHRPDTTNASVTTQRPVTTNASVTTQRPDTTNASVTTQRPDTTNASVTTQRPDTTNASVTTQRPVTTNASVTTQRPDTTNASVTTQRPDTTNASVTTQRPDTTNASVTTQRPVTTNASITTQTPVTKNASITTQRQVTTNSSVTTHRPVTTNSSASPSPSPRAQIMYINEIMLDKKGGFQKIELYVSSQADLTHYAMVMVDGGTNKTMSIIHLEHTQQNNGFIMVTFDNNTNPVMNTKGIGIAIYDTNQMSSVFKDSWTVSKDGLVDALVIGRSYAQVSDHLVQILTPGMIPFVLDPSLYGNEKTITRCSEKFMRSTDMFALLNPSMGLDNGMKCQERLHFQHNIALKFSADCRLFDDSNETGQDNMRHLMHFIIKEVNKKCHCGMTRMHIEDPNVSCCGGTSLDMKFVAPNQMQGDALLKNYKAFIQSTTDVDIDNKMYKLDNACYSNCCSAPVPHKTDDKSKNTKVTVAVIVTCMFIFMVILILVLLYMRRKKTAVYQFRMSRLHEEEEDYPMGLGDQDEFVGGQEATFDIKA